MVREANNNDLLAEMMRAISDAQRIAAIKKSPPLEEANLAYRNLHGEGFEPVGAKWGLDEVGVSFGAATADFDNDGDLDIVYLNYNGGLSVFRNDVTGSHRVQIRLRGVQSNRFGVGAIVRIETDSGQQSRTMTIARGYTSGSELVAHFGLGADTRINRLTIDWPSGKRQTLTSLEADRAYLITEDGVAPAAAKPAPPLFTDRSKQLGASVGDESPLAVADKEQSFIPFRTDRRGPGVAMADVDGDGHDDIYLSATSGSPARILRWNGSGCVVESPPGILASAMEDGPPLFLDADQNGTPDLLVTKAGVSTTAWPAAFRPVIYSNDGHGRFSATDWLPEIFVNAGAVCAADIDGDGPLDLFIGGRSVPGRYPEKPHSFLLRHDHGHFVDITTQSPVLAEIGLVKSALFRDVDGDGRPDLLLALEWDFVRYFHNDGGGRFSDLTGKAGFTSGGRGWWNSLASADFNGDGRPDFAAGNLGLNTTYRATPEQPATLFYGDFAHNGTRLLAEAVNDNGTLYPLRSRSDLAARFPFILRKYPKNDAFARATMTDVFGADMLAAASVSHADNFSSGVFLSQSDGTYKFQAFPRIAQVGPMQGLVAADLDGDGNADVCAVQNTDAAIPRFDGGVGILLRGQGDGHFTALAPAESGILVPGNGRALITLGTEGTGRPALFLTRQSGATALLANESAHAWIELQLRGRKENPDAVGAHVQLAYSRRPPTHHEIALGGGWLSQSAPRLQIAIPAGDRILEAIVKWPDGRVSRHSAPTTSGRWTIGEPSDSK
jgi:hypothetical protein